MLRGSVEQRDPTPSVPPSVPPCVTPSVPLIVAPSVPPSALRHGRAPTLVRHGRAATPAETRDVKTQT
jgi:hypothetical protein